MLKPVTNPQNNARRRQPNRLFVKGFAANGQVFVVEIEIEGNRRVNEKIDLFERIPIVAEAQTEAVEIFRSGLFAHLFRHFEVLEIVVRAAHEPAFQVFFKK
jgi:hypothetical protein